MRMEKVTVVMHFMTVLVNPLGDPMLRIVERIKSHYSISYALAMPILIITKILLLLDLLLRCLKVSKTIIILSMMSLFFTKSASVITNNMRQDFFSLG